MAHRYQIWDKKSPIFTPIGEKLSAEEWANRYKFIKEPGAKMIISGGRINGSLMQEYDSFVEMYENRGFVRDPNWSDQEVLDQIELWDKQKAEDEAKAQMEAQDKAADEVTPVERIAAVMEYQMIESQAASASVMSADAINTNDVAIKKSRISTVTTALFSTNNETQTEEAKHSSAFNRVKRNYDKGLWTENMVKTASNSGFITYEEYVEIINKLLMGQ